MCAGLPYLLHTFTQTGSFLQHPRQYSPRKVPVALCPGALLEWSFLFSARAANIVAPSFRAVELLERLRISWSVQARSCASSLLKPTLNPTVKPSSLVHVKRRDNTSPDLTVLIINRRDCCVLKKIGGRRARDGYFLSPWQASSLLLAPPCARARARAGALQARLFVGKTGPRSRRAPLGRAPNRHTSWRPYRQHCQHAEAHPAATSHADAVLLPARGAGWPAAHFAGRGPCNQRQAPRCFAVDTAAPPSARPSTFSDHPPVGFLAAHAEEPARQRQPLSHLSTQ